MANLNDIIIILKNKIQQWMRKGGGLQTDRKGQGNVTCTLCTVSLLQYWKVLSGQLNNTQFKCQEVWWRFPSCYANPTWTRYTAVWGAEPSRHHDTRLLVCFLAGWPHGHDLVCQGVLLGLVLCYRLRFKRPHSESWCKVACLEEAVNTCLLFIMC